MDWLSWGAGHFRDFPKRLHFLCLMATDINGENDKIIRGELLCIFRMRETFYEVPFLKQHIIFLVTMSSFHYQVQVPQNKGNIDAQATLNSLSCVYSENYSLGQLSLLATKP